MPFIITLIAIIAFSFSFAANASQSETKPLRPFDEAQDRQASDSAQELRRDTQGNPQHHLLFHTR